MAILFLPMGLGRVSRCACELRQGGGIEPVLFLVMLERHFAIEEREVHRVGVGIENDLVEVPDDDGQRGQNRFVEVDRSSHIDPPARNQGRSPRP